MWNKTVENKTNMQIKWMNNWKTQWMNELMNKENEQMNEWMSKWAVSDLFGELPLSFLGFLQVLLILHVIQSHLHKNSKVIKLRAVIKIIVHLMLHRRLYSLKKHVHWHQLIQHVPFKEILIFIFSFTLWAYLNLPYVRDVNLHLITDLIWKQTCLKLHLNCLANLKLHTPYKLDSFNIY